MRTRCALARGRSVSCGLQAPVPSRSLTALRQLGKTHLGAGWGRRSFEAGLGKWEGQGQLPDTWFHGTVSKPCLLLAMLSGHVGGASLASTPTHMQTHTEVMPQHLAGHFLSPNTVPGCPALHLPQRGVWCQGPGAGKGIQASWVGSTPLGASAADTPEMAKLTL